MLAHTRTVWSNKIAAQIAAVLIVLGHKTPSKTWSKLNYEYRSYYALVCAHPSKVFLFLFHTYLLHHCKCAVTPFLTQHKMFNCKQ